MTFMVHSPIQVPCDPDTFFMTHVYSSKRPKGRILQTPDSLRMSAVVGGVSRDSSTYRLAEGSGRCGGGGVMSEGLGESRRECRRRPANRDSGGASPLSRLPASALARRCVGRARALKVTGLLPPPAAYPRFKK